jgi:hypothetical protein
MAMRFVASFSGEEADKGRVPAYEATLSLQGIARSFVLISNYLSTGKIRKRAPYSDAVIFYLEPPRQGCWEAVFDAIISHPASMIGGSLGIAITANLLTDGIRTVVSRCLGKEKAIEDPKLQELERRRPGDLDALVDAVEPSMLLAHTIINQGASNIFIVRGDNNIVTLDAESNEYVRASIKSPDDEFLDVSVGSLNVNTGNGRVYVHSIGKTVPFSIAREPDPGTYSNLSESLSRYARGRPCDVQIRFRRVIARDGRTKRFIIIGASIVSE